MLRFFDINGEEITRDEHDELFRRKQDPEEKYGHIGYHEFSDGTTVQTDWIGTYTGSDLDAYANNPGLVFETLILGPDENEHREVRSSKEEIAAYHKEVVAEIAAELGEKGNGYVEAY